MQEYNFLWKSVFTQVELKKTNSEHIRESEMLVKFLFQSNILYFSPSLGSYLVFLTLPPGTQEEAQKFRL